MDNVIKLIVLICIHDFIHAFGQTFLKDGTGDSGHEKLSTVKGFYTFLKCTFSNPKIWLALSINTSALVVWLLILSFADLSLAFPLDSLQYVIITLFAIIFLKEKVDKWRWIGIAIIIAGVIVVGID